MKMFVFERIDLVSGSWHPEGGLMIVAKDKNHAQELIDQDDYVEVTEDEWKDVIVFDLAGNPDPKFITFPDAGCC